MSDDSANYDASNTDVLATDVVEGVTTNLPTEQLPGAATHAWPDDDTVALVMQCPRCGIMFSSAFTDCPVDGAVLVSASRLLAPTEMTGHPAAPRPERDDEDDMDATDITRIRDEQLGVVADQTIRGRVLDGRFYVGELIGEGGMGSVYRGSQLSVGRPVAIKVVHKRISNDPAIRARFSREARLVSSFTHPNTVRLIDFGEAEGHLYIAMELVEGLSLQALAGRGPMSVAFALEIVDQLSGPLAEAHRADVVHRDLKPENIFVTRTPDLRLQVKLLDFGVAHIDPSTANEEADTYRELTRQGIVVGTPEYMAPEQARGEVVTPASDLFALGVVLYQMLTGALPFHGTTPMHTMFQLVTKPVPPIRDHLPGCPLPLVELVEALLQKEPARRVASVAQLQLLLRRARAELGLKPVEALPDGDLTAVLESLVFQNTAMEATADAVAAPPIQVIPAPVAAADAAPATQSAEMLRLAEPSEEPPRTTLREKAPRATDPTPADAAPPAVAVPQPVETAEVAVRAAAREVPAAQAKQLRARARAEPTAAVVQRPYLPPEMPTVASEGPDRFRRRVIWLAIGFVVVLAVLAWLIIAVALA